MGSDKVAMDDVDVARKNVTKLYSAAKHYSSLNPQLAAFYMSQAASANESMDLASVPSDIACQFCGSVFRPGNHVTRLDPKARLSKRMRRMMARQERSSSALAPLGRLQRKLVYMYMTSHTKIVRICLMCERKSVVPCPTRAARSRTSSGSSSTVTPTMDFCFSSIAQEATLSRSARKRMKKNLNKKEKRRQEQEQSNLEEDKDSGLDLSLSSSSHISSGGGSIVSRSIDTLPSLNETPQQSAQLKPKHTSTPKANPGWIHSFGPKSNPAKGPSGKGPETAGSKSNKKDKKGILHRLLAKNKKEKSDTSNSSSLTSFLSSL